MNKLLSKIATLSVGLVMAAGVGVAFGQRGVQKVEATTPSADTRYELVNNVSKLEAGKNYLIASGKTGSVKVMSTVENTNNRRAVSTTLVDNQIAFADDMLNLELGGSAGAWTLLTTNYAGTDGYLASAASGKNNNCRVLADPANITISFSGDAAVITIAPHESRNKLRFNSDSNLFACYSTGQADVYLFREVVGGVKLVDLSLSGTAKSTYYEGESFNPSGLTVTANYSDSSHVNVTGDVVWTPNPLTTETTKVTGTYKGKTVEYNVTVNPDAVASIAVAGEMTQKAYYAGTSWNPTGLTVTATYDSGRVVENITENVSWAYNPASPAMGITSVVATATYETKSADSSAQTVTVSEFTGYARVTSLEGFTVGDSYVIGVNPSSLSKNLMGAVNVSNPAKPYRSVVDGSSAIVDGYMGVNTPLPSGVVVVSLLKTGTNQYVLYDITNDKYLAGDPVDNYVSDEDSLENATAWNFAFDGEGNLTVTLVGSERVFGYNTNSSSLRFSTYAGYKNAITNVAFYRLAGSTIKTALNTFCTDSLKMNQYDGDNSYNEERCTANYAAAKTAYAALSDAEKNVFANASEFANAKERLTKWAAANNEEFDPAAGTFETSVLYTPVMNFENNAGYVVIIAVITLSAIAFGVVVLTYKRKHQ